MAFNFGTPAPAAGGPSPAPATAAGATTFGAAPAGGGFNFTTASTGASAPASFSLGAPAASAAQGAAPTAAPGAPAPASGLGAPAFGAAPAPTAPASVFGSAPAAPTTGGTATTTGTPAPGGAPTFSSAPAPPAAAAAFGTTPAPASTTVPAPAPGSFSFASAPSATTAPPGASAESISISEYRSVFPNLQILSKVTSLLSKLSDTTDEGTLAGQELIHVLNCDQSSNNNDSAVGQTLSKPLALNWTTRNDAFRTRLQSNPTVKLHGKDAAVTPEMIREIWELADDLRIGEQDAMSLYAAASDPEMRRWLETRLDGSFVDGAGTSGVPASALVLGNDVPKAARELFFYERGSTLTVLLLLIQHRIEAASATGDSPNALLVATDQLIQNKLVENLISLVLEWTRLADDLQRERAQNNSTQAHASFIGVTLTPSSSSSSQSKGFTTVLLNYAYKQRQLAAECLFYLTYHTQCTAEEVASLIDLIKDVTNGRDEASGLPILDPFVDIPSAFENPNPAPTSTGPWTATPFAAPLPPPLKEKDPLAWQNELVGKIWETGGKPQLLKCVGVLVMSVISALDGRHTLLDRNLHGPNDFGVGNALLPPSSGPVQSSTDSLIPIHSRLDPRSESDRDWKRKDIWGLLASSYALLLLPVEEVVASPRHRNRSPSNSPAMSPRPGRIDIKSTWQSCLEAPTQMKSFSFARLSLIPSFERRSVSPDRKCDNYEFFMSVLSEFVAQYLDILCASGNVPISREQWKSDEETELEVKRDQQEQQRQFMAWSGAQTTEMDAIPTEVDLMKRPDCMDDVVALAVAVCSTGPEYAVNFWSVADETVLDGDVTTRRTKLVPSRALKTLDRLQTKDGSLLPAYLSFLAALALADAPGDNPDKNGADLVHSMLSQEFDTSGDSSRKATWSSVLHIIRWYARELNASATGTSGTTDTLRSSSSTTTGFGSTSTGYYYGADNTVDGMGFHSSHSQQHTTTTATSTENKPKELGEKNTTILLSHLALISSVTSNSVAARRAVSSMKLPVGDNLGGDDLLTMLFSLAIAPIAPAVRGEVLTTISNLLRVVKPREEDKDSVKKIARKGWDLLEASQVLPITLLDQYSSPPGRVGGISAGIKFPPSSTAQVSTGAEGQYGTPWTPPDNRYGIIYEMEHVESRMGFYPSTEGLLHLLATLVSVAGCPSDLGRSRRVRSGCTPYIEYVIHFVLPRAMGLRRNDGGLPFRTLGDKSRLVTLALEVVEAVISRYVVPAPSSASQQSYTDAMNATARETARTIFGLSSAADSISVCPNDADYSVFAADYRDETVSAIRPNAGDAGLYGTNGFTSSSSESAAFVAVSGEGSFPSPKSPGFIVLHDVLSSISGDLFKAVASILSEHAASRGIRALFGLPEYEETVAAALFGGTAPTFSSAKTSLNPNTPNATRQSLLRPPFPAGDKVVCVGVDGLRCAGSTDGAFWRERSVALALRIMCAAAAREDNFARAVNALSVPLKIVPVLRFQKPDGRVTSVHVYDVRVSRLADLLKSSAGTWVPLGESPGVLSTIVEYIGYVSPSHRQDAHIASPAVALVVYIDRTLSMNESIQVLCVGVGGDKLFASAMARRLRVSSRLVDYRHHQDLVGAILDLLVAGLRTKSSCEVSLSDLMLGLPTSPAEDQWTLPNVEGSNDSFGVILELLAGVDFVRDHRYSGFAKTCYEIMYRMVCTQNMNGSRSLSRVLYASERLRLVDFWHSNLLLFLGNSDPSSSMLQDAASKLASPTGNENILHCIAWLLKGVSNELRLLMGVTPLLHDSPLPSQIRAAAAPRPGQCRKLLEVLFADPDLLAVHALNDLPLECNEGIDTATFPSADVMKSAVVSLPGPPEVVRGYSIISVDKMLQKMGADGQKELANFEESTASWAEKWNCAVARDCAISHLAYSLRLVIGSSFTFCRSLLFHDFGQDRTHGRAPLDVRGVAQMLALILTRFAGEGTVARGMDDSLHSSATLQLAMSAFILVQEIAGKEGSSQSQLLTAEGDVIRIYSFLAKAIVSSATGGEARGSQQKERTALLGSSLTLIENMFQGTDQLRTFDQERETFILASSALANVASIAVNGSSRMDWTERGEHSAAMARIARSSLSALVRFHDVESSSLEDSFIYQVFARARTIDGASNSSLSSFVSLVATLDDDIYSLLSRIALCRFGTELLHDAGLLSSLVRAAEYYSAEEERVQAQVNSTHRKVQISPPSFLLGHLFLLSTMLSSPSISTERRKKLAVDAKEVVHRHSRTIERAILSFPNDGDVTKEFMRCLDRITASLLVPEKVNDMVNPWKLQAVDAYGVSVDRDGTALERGVLHLTYNLSLYPFPPRYLPPLPPTLKDRGEARGLPTQPQVVSLIATESETWWNAMETGFVGTERMPLPDPPTGPSRQGMRLDDMNEGWSSLHYEFSTQGCEILEATLSFLIRRVLAPPALSIDYISLAKGFCRCADAARAIEGRLRFVQDASNTAHLTNAFFDMEVLDTNQNKHNLENRKETEYLLVLGPTLGRCAEKFLILALSLLRRETQDSMRNPERDISYQYNTSVYDLSTAMLASLDHTQVESMGIGCIGWREGDESRRDVAKKISQSLRKVLQGEMKRFA